MLAALLSYSFKADIGLCEESKKLQVKSVIDGKEYVGYVDRYNYDLVREMIIKVNHINLPRQAKTREMQEQIDRKYRLETGKSKETFEDLVTSLVAKNGFTPKQIAGFTMYQIRKIMARHVKISEYETNVSFLCAGAEKIKLEHWSSNIPDSKDDIVSSLDDYTGAIKSTIKH